MIAHNSWWPNEARASTIMDHRKLSSTIMSRLTRALSLNSSSLSFKNRVNLSILVPLWFVSFSLVFSILSKLITSGFVLNIKVERLLRYTIGLKNSRQFFIQSVVKPKPIVNHSHAFSRALRQLHVITSSLAVIGSLFCVCSL